MTSSIDFEDDALKGMTTEVQGRILEVRRRLEDAIDLCEDEEKDRIEQRSAAHFGLPGAE